MRIVLLILFFFSSSLVVAQEKYLDRKGTIVFEASEATFEPVKAQNNSVTAILNTQTGKIASLALVKEFMFRNALMQEHFNENYIESDIYPKATFKGKIVDFNFNDLTTVEKVFVVKGILNLRGVDKEITTKLFLAKEQGLITLRGNFIATPQDFNIKIPKIVRNKIAKEVRVQLNFKMKAL